MPGQSPPSFPRPAGVTAIAWLVLVGALGPSVSCERSGQASPAAEGPAPTLVQLAEVQPVPVDEASEYVATVKSLGSTTIRPEVEGQVTHVLVTSGHRVNVGAPLLRIDARRQAATVSSQQAEIEAREADLGYARQELTRARDLHQQEIVSQQQLDQAEATVRAAEAEVQSLRARLREQRVQLQYHEVLAPAAGIVGDIPVRVGDRVTPDTVLTTIDTNDALEIHVSVPLERASDLRRGLPVEITDASGSVVTRTVLAFVSPRADEDTQTVLAKAIVRGGQVGLRSSQYVTARVIWRSAPGLLVPVLSVLRLNDQSFVFVAESQKGGLVAKQRPVRLGPIVGNAYRVLDGLAAGARVVTSGVQKLADGAPIKAQG